VTVVRSGSASDVGRVRSLNEDRFLESVALFAVADGMGGHAGGEVASDLAIAALQRAFAVEPSRRGLVEAVRQANKVVWERSLRDPDVRGMGTTLTAAALVPTQAGDRLVVVNVGDSRAYRFFGGALSQMTTDHSVAEELVARGELSEAEAAVHPQRHILTRALGIGPEVDVDAWELLPSLGERFLLCSDGLTNEVSDVRIAEVLRTVAEPRQVADTLVRLANEHGGNDNVTVVVVDVVVADPGGSGSPEPLQTVGAAMAPGTRVRGEPPSDRPGGTGPEAGGSPAPPASDDRTRGTGDTVGMPAAPVTAGSDGVAPVVPVAVGGSQPAGGVAVAAASATSADRWAVSDRATSASTGAPDRPAVTAPAAAGFLESAGEPDTGDPGTGEPATGLRSTGDSTTMARHVTSALADVITRRSGPAPGSGPDQHRRHVRRVTVRVVVFMVLVAAVVFGAWSVLRFYAEDAYYVGVRGDRIVVYQGRPGGFLGFQPHVVDVSTLTVGEVLSFRVPELRSGVQESSRGAAEQFVANLRSELCAAKPTSPVCVSPTTAAAPGTAAAGPAPGLTLLAAGHRAGPAVAVGVPGRSRGGW